MGMRPVFDGRLGIHSFNDYCPTTLLGALEVPPLDRSGSFAARALFMPSFAPEFCVTVEQAGGECVISLASLQVNIWHWAAYGMIECGELAGDVQRPRGPERWQDRATLSNARLSEFRADIDECRPEVIDDPSVDLDGMRVHCELLGDRHEVAAFGFQYGAQAPANDRLAGLLHDLAREMFRDRRSVWVLDCSGRCMR